MRLSWFSVLVLTAGLVAGTLSSATAADSTLVGWQKSLAVDVTTTQTSYSDSWVGGEAGAVNWVGNLKGSAEKQLKEWLNFRTNLKLSFGQALTQETTTDAQGRTSKHWLKPKKSTDLIDWENVGRFTLHGLIDPYAAFRLESQFLDASSEAKKLYFTPIRLTESAGMSKKLYEQEKDFVTSRLGLAAVQIMKGVLDTNLTTLDSTLTYAGLESVTDAELTLHESITYTGKLSLYKALFYSEKDKVKGTAFEDDWKAIDVNWENIISASVTKVVTVNLYTQLLYDKEVSKKGRFKETLAMGLVFKLY